MDLIERVPARALAPQDITHLVRGITRVLPGSTAPCFSAREQREGAETYLHGLLLDIPRMFIEPMVLALNGVDPNAVRALQLCIE